MEEELDNDELETYDRLQANSKWNWVDPRSNKTRNMQRVHVQVKKQPASNRSSIISILSFFKVFSSATRGVSN